jgi:hypothetical protein
MLALTWDWSGLTQAWDWSGIGTHLGIEEAASLIMAGILLYGRHHLRRGKGWAHRFAHNYTAQFIVDLILDAMIAIMTIQIMHL